MIHLTLEMYSKIEVILCLTIDNKFSFDNHVMKICRKATDLRIIKNIKLFRLKTKRNSFQRNDKITV